MSVANLVRDAGVPRGVLPPSANLPGGVGGGETGGETAPDDDVSTVSTSRVIDNYDDDTEVGTAIRRSFLSIQPSMVPHASL